MMSFLADIQDAYHRLHAVGRRRCLIVQCGHFDRLCSLQVEAKMLSKLETINTSGGEMAMNKPLLQVYAFKCLGFHYSRLGEIE